MTINKVNVIKWAKRISYGLGILLALFICFYASIHFGLWGKIPDKEQLARLKQSQATQVLDAHTDLIGKIYVYDRQSIKYDDFPQHLINALVATEDVRFYEHSGIDSKSLLRVFFKSILMSDDSSGGGSTITLQLAKNLFGRKNYGPFGIVVNKIRESIVARRIEDLYSKEEILTLYLNTVPFPDNTYGIESASEKFFNVRTKDLTLVQSATLVGSLKANTSYNPRRYPEKSGARKNVVIHQMEKYGFLSEMEANKATTDSIVIDYQNYSPNEGLAPYFRAEIKKQLDSLLKQKKYRKPDGEMYNIYHDGLKIHTTLDNTMQRYAEAAMAEHMSDLQRQFEKAYGQNAPWLKGKSAFEAAKKRLKSYKKFKAQGLDDKAIEDSLKRTHQIDLFSWDETTVASMSTLDSLEYYSKFLNAGLVSLDPSNGAIKAYVGGIDYSFFQFDHIVQSKRQVGSTFKPFVYTAALENGMDPCTYIPIKAITYTDVNNWRPTNAGSLDDEDLNYSLQKALSNSINTIAVKVLYETGLGNVITQAKKMGITSNIEAVPSIALGSSNLSVLELAKAYTSYVNGSKPSNPMFITKIEDKDGNIVASFKDLYPERSESDMAFSNDTRQVMLEFLKATVNEGTATRLRSTYQLPNALAGKTGTTQDNKDGWFVGIMPKLVTVTWVGNDNQQIGFSSTGLGQGANSALPIFAKYLQKLNADSNYNSITKASFESPSEAVLSSLNCDPTKTDGFFKRLFGGNKDERQFKKKEEKKKKGGGIFGWLKKKDKDR
ncbi:transglycosylase domain-containing protein [Gelidibacter salicanalis]|uniref:Transglycosylase domain-containing protein n=1 Tax=Gelidibacter salicanalis TaxID=291193 RepID=A0A934KLI3_9FLAO|nr:transglycosylase domain-containing protein [Gelidibacter salicanalis]MBJ7879429.1 transglycosylase domain-containing protein [Gelidibacter salicanalis]